MLYSLLQLLALPLLAVLVLILGMRVALRLIRRWWPRTTAQVETPRCDSCGYDLSGLEIPRCPECGALRGFKVPLTELGLTEEELRGATARRRSELNGASVSADAQQKGDLAERTPRDDDRDQHEQQGG